MKICWDNLEGLRYDKRGFWWKRVYSNRVGKLRKQRIEYYYKDACDVCKEPFLAARQQKRNYCTIKCFGLDRSGEKNNKWKGGRSVVERGYGEYIRVNVKPGQRKWEHIVKAESALGRELKDGEVVHHIDCDGTNNLNSNLLVCKKKYHQWLHCRMARAWVEDVYKVGL